MSIVVCLISCMHEKDHSIVERTNVQTDCVVVNQCDVDKVDTYSFTNKLGKECLVKFISTTERGLSRSRNMAVANAPTDAICLICDDDETLADDYETSILAAYTRHPEAGAIAFAMNRPDKKNGKTYPSEDCKLGFTRILKTTSVELSFRKSALSEKGIRFDEKMGSGTGNGGGEENRFMLSLRRAGVKMFYCTENIGTVNPAPSQWFKGYGDPQYLLNFGWATRRAMGPLTGLAYITYWTATHRQIYADFGSPIKTFRQVMKGYFQKR